MKDGAPADPPERPQRVSILRRDEPAAVVVGEEHVVVLGQEADRDGRVRVGAQCAGQVEELPPTLVAEGRQPGAQPLDDGA